jgi:glutamate-1-semialdehyde 2,1-aminomutase
MMSSRYLKSEEQLHRAEKSIPLGSQTFSKSKTQYPVGISPLFAKRAKGAYLWDIDGNKYVDLVSSLASITLGYGNSQLNQAVKQQLKEGVILSLPSVLESEVAELLIELIPSAEMVRFGKNGTDATSAAVRLARAYTGKKHVLVCGYHGWQDWYIGSTTRNKGVPKDVSDLTHTFTYNDIENLKYLVNRYSNDVAAIVMEPMNIDWPKPGYLEEVKKIAEKFGIVLVFDETITGFRFSDGGAQKLFGVIPHLSTFGKGLANGFPISAVVGKREIMLEMEEIFFSGTFGGELLSLAAAKYVLLRHKKENISAQLAEIGGLLSSKVENIINTHNLNNHLNLRGHNSWKFLSWEPTEQISIDEFKTYFMQEMFANGILVLGTHNVTLAHNEKVINRIVSIYDEILSNISNHLIQGDLKGQLLVPPLKPLFKVR